MPVIIRYRFTQVFAVPPKQAYLWCTDFTPQDHLLMGHENVERQVLHVSDGIVLLQEVFHTSNGDVEKQKIVHLYPKELRWVSTHLTGPNKHSQFSYKISPENGCSKLEFEALHVENGRDITRVEAGVLVEQLRRNDSEAWRLLAEAMNKEFKDGAVNFNSF